MQLGPTNLQRRAFTFQMCRSAGGPSPVTITLWRGGKASN
jgi:hypothetical protein